MRIKNRDKWIPGGYQVLIADAGMKKPFSGSFNEAVNFLHAFRAKNPALCEKHGWSLDIDDITLAVDLYNCQRMIASGFDGFVELEGEAAEKKKIGPASSLFRKGANAVGQIKTAVSMYADLFGTQGKVVSRDEAEARAAVCVACPLNDASGGLKKYFVTETARELMALFGMLNDMDLKTSLDDKLGVCTACSCPMRAKAWIDGAILKKNIPKEDIAKLHPDCWIPSAIA